MGGFLNSFFADWFEMPASHRLPFRYNALRTMYWFTHSNPGYWDAVKPIKILHFCCLQNHGILERRRAIWKPFGGSTTCGRRSPCRSEGLKWEAIPKQSAADSELCSL